VFIRAYYYTIPDSTEFRSHFHIIIEILPSRSKSFRWSFPFQVHQLKLYTFLLDNFVLYGTKTTYNIIFKHPVAFTYISYIKYTVFNAT
jgi:hypothetical protein